MLWFLLILAALAVVSVITTFIRMTDDQRSPHLAPPRSRRGDS